MNHFHVPQLAGVDKDHHARMIPDERCSDLLNVWFKDGKISRRGGYTNLATLNGIVTSYEYFELMYSSDTYPMAFTTTDVYYYDYSSSTWVFLTPDFDDGTVTCAGTTAVTLVPSDGVAQNGGITISPTVPESWETNQETITYIGGVEDVYPATNPLGFSAADTINVGAAGGTFFGIWLIQISGAGPSTKVPLADQVYATAALALAAKPAPDAGHLEIGYIIVECNAGASWTAGVDDLVAGSDCTSVVFVDVAEDAVSWNTSWPSGGQYQIGFGTTDPNAVTTWYAVQTITSRTTMTLATNGPVVAGSTYTLRQCYNGNYGQIPVMFDHVIVVDPSTNDSLMLFANGTDPCQQFDGTTVSDLPGAPYSGKFLAYYHNHTIMAYLRDITTGDYYPQSVAYSVAGDPTDWAAAGSGITQLTADPGVITGMAMLKEHLFVFKQMSITTVMYTQNATSPFDFIENTANIGTPIGRTIGVVDNNFLFFLGPDSIYMFDGVNCVDVGIGITRFLIDNLNYPYLETSHAVVMRDHHLYCLFVPIGDTATTPNYCFAYDYQQKIWTIWTFSDRISGSGKLAKTQFFTRWMDVPAGTTWAAYPGTWGGRRLSSGAPYTVLGDTAGGLHKFDDTATDNGTAITAWFVTSDFDCGDPKHSKKFLEFIYAAYPDVTAAYDDLNLSCSVDYGNSWYGPVTVTLEGTTDMTEHVFNTIQFGKQIRYKIENVTGGDFEVEGLVVGYHPTGQGRGVTIPR